MTLNSICTSPAHQAYAPLDSQDLEAAVSPRMVHDSARDTFQTVMSRHHAGTPPIIFRVQHAASYSAAPTSILAHVAKSTIYGLIIGMTAISGMMFLSLVADKKMQTYIAKHPVEAFLQLEAMGASIGAVVGTVIGICQPAPKQNFS